MTNWKGCVKSDCGLF